MTSLDPITALAIAKQAKDNLPLITRVVKWIRSRIHPKAPKNSTGIAIGIITENSVNREQITHDFVNTIEKYLSKSSLKKPFYVVDLPERFAKKIKNIDDAREVLIKTRCTFIIWGLARKRNFKLNSEKEAYFILDLETAVLHNLIPVETSASFSKEMYELLPLRRSISDSNDLTEFELNASSIELAARYVIGVAAALSQNTDYSIEIFEEIHRQIKDIQSSTTPSQIRKSIKFLQERVVTNLIAIHFENAKIQQTKWRKTRDVNYLDLMLNEIKKAEVYSSNDYRSAIFRAIYHFGKERDTKKARQVLAPWKKTYIDDASWAFSEAFLLAYEGKLREAIRIYKIAFRRTTVSPVLLEVEEFLSWILSENPDKVQIYFCLGLINYFGIGEYKSAKEDFLKFLDYTQDGEFPEQRALAEKYIKEINLKES